MLNYRKSSNPKTKAALKQGTKRKCRGAVGDQRLGVQVPVEKLVYYLVAQTSIEKPVYYWVAQTPVEKLVYYRVAQTPGCAKFKMIDRKRVLSYTYIEVI